MKIVPRYRLFRRSRGGNYLIEDTRTGRQTSTGTSDRAAAERLLLAHGEADRNSLVSLQMARIYLAAGDPAISRRTWAEAVESLIASKHGETRRRWEVAARDRALRALLPLPLVETRADELLAALRRGTVSTNVHLRKLHNYCVGLGWLPWPLLPKALWPAVKPRPKRAITETEHRRILGRETNPERADFYELCWHLGGAQGDIASLQAGDVDWGARTIAYFRRKTGATSLVHFGEAVAAVLARRPRQGPLFPYLATVRSGDRATEFGQRCRGLGITGVTLHSYRYAWAERARSAGYPERFAQEALGHNSKAIHRAYARRAQVQIPALEDYERRKLQCAQVLEWPRPADGPATMAAGG